MTVGLYLHGKNPMMISDCLALPSVSGKMFFSPSNIEMAKELGGGQVAQLVSKFVSPDEKTLVSFAGNAESCQKFSAEMLKSWRERASCERPMAFLKDADYHVRSDPSMESMICSVLGAAVVSNLKNEGSYRVNTYSSKSEHWKFSTSCFGDCHLIGSGAGYVRKFLESADRLAVSTGLSPEIQWELTFGALNGSVFFGPNRRPDERTWGGLLQNKFFDSQLGKWCSSPPWFHLALAFEGENWDFKGVLPKQVLLTSSSGNESTDAVFTGVRFDNQTSDFGFWPIASGLMPAKSNQVDFSSSFRCPEMITISCCHKKAKSHRLHHRTYKADVVPGLDFWVRNNDFGWEIEGNEISCWIRSEILRELAVLPELNVH